MMVSVAGMGEPFPAFKRDESLKAAAALLPGSSDKYKNKGNYCVAGH